MPIPITHMPLGFVGITPDGQSDAEFFILRDDISFLKRHGPTWRYEDAALLQDALATPDCTFEDLKRKEYGVAIGYCYCVKPNRCYGDDGKPQPPPPDMVFIVFVRVDFGYVVFHWEWRQEDRSDLRHPLGWRNDFGRRLWRKP